MFHQQSQAIVPLRGERCARHSRRGCAPEPHACFAGYISRTGQRVELSSSLGDVPRDRAEPLQVCSPQRTPVLHVIRHRANGGNRTRIEKLGRFSPYQSASFANTTESGHRDSNSAGTVWKTGFSPREIPAMAVPIRTTCKTAAGAFGTAGAHVRNRTESASIPTRCTAIVLHRQAQRGATRPHC